MISLIVHFFSHDFVWCVIKEIWVFLSEYLNDDGWVYICKTGVLDLSGDGGIPWRLLQIWKLFYQEWGRLIYVRGFQLISGIQHAILQKCYVWGRYMQMRAHVRLSEAWCVCVGSCVLDALLYGHIVVNVRSWVWMDYSQMNCGKHEIVSVDGLFPNALIVYTINTYEWNQHLSSLKPHTTTETTFTDVPQQWSITLKYDSETITDFQTFIPDPFPIQLYPTGTTITGPHKAIFAALIYSITSDLNPTLIWSSVTQ